MAGPVEQAPPTLTLDLALQMLQGAIAYARERGYRMGMAVVDAHGNLVGSVRMDGARFLTPETARAKAYASAAYGRPSPSDSSGEWGVASSG
jgi:glc operon protein GlcG